MLGNLLLAAAMAMPALGSLKDLAHCDPLRKDTRCPPDPAFAGKASFNFSTTGWDQKDLGDFWEIDNDTAHDRRRLEFDTGGQGVGVGVWQAGDAPTLVSRKYILFGKVSVTVKAAKGRGIVTAITLKSDSGDEIDWELLGAYPKQAASNYFYDGKALFNTYNDTYPLATSSYDAYHTYAVEWTDTRLVLSIDGSPLKTWRLGHNFDPPAAWPQTPMQVKLGTWVAGGKNAPEGTLQWAGGRTDFSKKPFVGIYKRIKIVDYAGKSEAAKGGIKEYVYGDNTGSAKSIKVIEGKSDSKKVNEENGIKGGQGEDNGSSSHNEAKSILEAGSSSTDDSSATRRPSASTSDRPLQTGTAGGDDQDEQPRTTMATATGASNSTATARPSSGPNGTSVPTSAAGRSVASFGALAVAAVAMALL